MSNTLHVTPAQVLAAKLAVEMARESGEEPDEALVAIARAEVIVPPGAAAASAAPPTLVVPLDSTTTMHGEQATTETKASTERGPAAVAVSEVVAGRSEPDHGQGWVALVEGEGSELSGQILYWFVNHASSEDDAALVLAPAFVCLRRDDDGVHALKAANLWDGTLRFEYKTYGELLKKSGREKR